MDESTYEANIGQSQNVKTFADAKKGQHMNVYIWDMDETLILLKSLLDGTYAKSSNGVKDSRKGIEIGQCWENHILQVCDDCFFYEQIENYMEPYLHALSEHDDGRDLSNYDFSNDGFSFPYDNSNKRRLAYRHRAIAQKYEQGLLGMLDQQMIELWDALYRTTDSYTDGWLSSGHAFLEQALCRKKISASHLDSSEIASDSIDHECRSVNVLVTSGALVPSLVKCLLFRLDDVISHDNVYSSFQVGKLQCFSWIKDRFDGPDVRFCAIGDGMEECEAAEKMWWPFIKIDLQRPHRFPDLTMTMVKHYMDVIYGPLNAEDDDEQ